MKNEYYSMFVDSLNKNKDKIVASFCDYYGKSYEGIIRKRLNRIIYFPCLSESLISFALRNSLRIPKKRAKILKKFIINYYSDNNQEFSPLLGTYPALDYSEIEGCVDEVIESLDANIIFVNTDFILENGFNLFGSCFLIFQLFIHEGCAFFHELNHVVCNSDSYYEGHNYFYRKTGLYIRDNTGVDTNRLLFMELINDISSQEIYKLFEKRGGDFSKVFWGFDLFVSEYEKNLWLVDEFYQEFKELIKEASITDNCNELFYRVGKDNFKKFLNIFSDYYEQEIDLEEKEVVLECIHEIIMDMKEHVANTRHFTEEELNDYFENLESYGYRIKRLK